VKGSVVAGDPAPGRFILQYGGVFGPGVRWLGVSPNLAGIPRFVAKACVGTPTHNAPHPTPTHPPHHHQPPPPRLTVAVNTSWINFLLPD